MGWILGNPTHIYGPHMAMIFCSSNVFSAPFWEALHAFQQEKGVSLGVPKTHLHHKAKLNFWGFHLRRLPEIPWPSEAPGKNTSPNTDSPVKEILTQLYCSPLRVPCYEVLRGGSFASLVSLVGVTAQYINMMGIVGIFLLFTEIHGSIHDGFSSQLCLISGYVCLFEICKWNSQYLFLKVQLKANVMYKKKFVAGLKNSSWWASGSVLVFRGVDSFLVIFFESLTVQHLENVCSRNSQVRNGRSSTRKTSFRTNPHKKNGTTSYLPPKTN